jgi:hypothetical protein
MNRRGTSGQGRWLGRLTARLAGLAVVLTAAACSQGAATAVHTASTAKLTVTSTLDRLTVLPHRIHWQAFPIAPAADVSEVDYLIDGKQLWTEHNPPYFYGDDGNYLVTSFLTPGKHVFTVRAVGAEGQTATDAVTATVPPAPAPPAALAGTWKAWQRTAGGPAGYASLVIGSVGWYEGQFPVTQSNGNLEDVAYLSPGLVQIRTGMATGHDMVAGAPSDDDLNGWCNNAPGSPARYRWSVTGTHLRFTFAGGHPWPRLHQILVGCLDPGFVAARSHDNRGAEPSGPGTAAASSFTIA